MNRFKPSGSNMFGSKARKSDGEYDSKGCRRQDGQLAGVMINVEDDHFKRLCHLDWIISVNFENQ